MAGILDQKVRFLDSFITNAGKAQIASGKFKAEFYSFSDCSAFYSKTDNLSNEEEISTKFCFEATNTPHDQITFEVNDSGKLTVRELTNSTSGTIKLTDGQIFFSQTDSFNSSSFDSAQIANQLISSSVDSFKNLYILKSPSVFDQNKTEFSIEPKYINFNITDRRPIENQANGGTQTISINNLESLFADKKLSHIPNFDFLPPVNKNTNSPIAEYTNIRGRGIQTEEDLKNELLQYRNNGFTQTISFLKSSRENRIFGQFFEISSDGIAKLDVVDFGLFQDSDGKTKHVFFAGKLLVDNNNSHTFVNLFTILFF